MKIFLTLIAAALILPACATVNKGASDFFRIDSVPQGAAAVTTIETAESLRARRKNPKLTPQYIGCSPTPCAIKLNRREEFVIKLEHPDFQTAEMFISNSRNSASFTANMAATGVGTAGTAAAGAAIGAGLATALGGVATGVASATTASAVTISTFGLIPIEASFAAANSAFVAPSVSTGSATAAAIPPALAVTGGMLLIDAVSGANINLYPNPVVLELAPKGVPSKVDPNVVTFKADFAEKEALKDTCLRRRIAKRDGKWECRNLTKREIAKRERDAKAEYREARKKEWAAQSKAEQ